MKTIAGALRPAADAGVRAPHGTRDRLGIVGRLRAVMSYDRRIVLLALAAGLPGLVLSAALLTVGGYAWSLQVALLLLAAGLWLAIARMLRARVVRPLQTVSNVLAALREDDFSIRGRGAAPDDAMGQLMLELNTLAETVRAQRLGAHEATTLLRTVIEEIDAAIFAFDGSARLVLVNRAGARLVGRDVADLLSREAWEIGLGEALESSGVQDLSFPGGSGLWEIRRSKFWQGGTPHELVVLSDISQPLREQEREAWKRLIRVIGHELNNSLAPIKSIAGSLEALVARTPPPDDWRDDMQRGLAVIAARAEALGRFTNAYARLARLPSPRRTVISLAPLLRRVTALESRLPVSLQCGPEVRLRADTDQLEQLLINVLRNAADAALETGGGVTVGWRIEHETVEIHIDDEGPGLHGTANLFVPFFTTKPGGSGIGLVLSRQIAEAHGGSLTLENREQDPGARAILRLPI